jgi:hypothetical protein
MSAGLVTRMLTSSAYAANAFCGAVSKIDIREVLLEEIEQGVQDKGEEEHAQWTALSDGTPYRKRACNLTIVLYRR